MLVCLLRGAVYRNEYPVETGVNCFPGLALCEEVGIGGGDGVNLFCRSVLDQLEKFRMQVWFALKIEIKIDQSFAYFVEGVFVKIKLHIAGGAGKVLETAGTLGAAEIAGGGGFDRDIERHAPLNGFAGPFG